MSTNKWQGTWRGRSPSGAVHTRARNVISPSGGIVRGKFPSRKNGRMVQYEGLLELDAIYLFEASPLVDGYREQPITLRYPDGDKLRRYTPDFEVTLTSGEVILVEVKPVRSQRDEAVRHKLACVASYLRRSAKAFVVLDESSLRDEPRQSNLRRIYHRAPRVPLTASACKAAAAYCSHQFPMPISLAKDLLLKREVDPFSLLLAGLVRCDLDQPVTPQTLLYLTSENDDVWFQIAQGHGF